LIKKGTRDSLFKGDNTPPTPTREEGKHKNKNMSKEEDEIGGM
jgi:hypothetical protein